MVMKGISNLKLILRDMKHQCRLKYFILKIKFKGGNYINDDANLKLFMDHLIKFAIDSIN